MKKGYQTVIASRRLDAAHRPVSEAIQSRIRLAMDCFVARAPRNDGGRSSGIGLRDTRERAAGRTVDVGLQHRIRSLFVFPGDMADAPDGEAKEAAALGMRNDADARRHQSRFCRRRHRRPTIDAGP
jgi:hypothetical protein